MPRPVIGFITQKGYEPFPREWLTFVRDKSTRLERVYIDARWAVCFNPESKRYYGLRTKHKICTDVPRLIGPQFTTKMLLSEPTLQTIEFDTLEQAITCCDLTD